MNKIKPWELTADVLATNKVNLLILQMLQLGCGYL